MTWKKIKADTSPLIRASPGGMSSGWLNAKAEFATAYVSHIASSYLHGIPLLRLGLRWQHLAGSN